MSMVRASKNQKNQWGFPDPERLEALVRGLGSDRPAERGRARATLVSMGRVVVPRLIQILGDRSGHMRWESARALVSIRDPSAAPALMEALEDEMLEVRWIAEDGLIDLGKDGLVSLLHGLITHSGSNRFREAAHRILTAMAHGDCAEVAKPILEALEGPASTMAIPVAAFTALNSPAILSPSSSSPHLPVPPAAGNCTSPSPTPVRRTPHGDAPPP